MSKLWVLDKIRVVRGRKFNGVKGVFGPVIRS